MHLTKLIICRTGKIYKTKWTSPEIPSAKEIETNGGDLGNLVKLQMQKIEELTLYIIELKKEIDLINNK